MGRPSRRVLSKEGPKLIPEEIRKTLRLNPDCAVCNWMNEWSGRELADVGMLMQPYIPHMLQHSIDDLAKVIDMSNRMKAGC
jgi:hypothetical protein